MYADTLQLIMTKCFKLFIYSSIVIEIYIYIALCVESLVLDTMDHPISLAILQYDLC